MVKPLKIAVLFSDYSVATATYIEDGWVYNCKCGKNNCKHIRFIKKLLGDEE